jgi:aldehyde dehydrogenase (NAD(P)+)
MSTIAAIHATTHKQIDWDLETLQTQKSHWTSLPLKEKIALLRAVRRGLRRVAKDLAELSAVKKGVDPKSNMAGDEWVLGPWAAGYAMTTLIATLERISAGRPHDLQSSVTRSGQLAVRVFPRDAFENLLVNGLTTEVWMEPGVNAANLEQHIAPGVKQPPPGKVALVLGAGNIVSIPILDTLHKLYAEGEVVMLKMNPVNDYAGPLIAEIFAPLINAGYIRMAYGGPDIGVYLTDHPGIETIHMTGSARTHDAIVFGVGEAGAARKVAKQPRLNKPVSSELGGVCPAIVTPGNWTPADITFQAENIVAQRLYHNGYNCCSTQVIVLPRGWDGAPALMAEIARLMRELPARHPYYPGSQQRADAARAAHPGAITFEHDPVRTLIPGLDANARQQVFEEEAFCAVLAQTALPALTVEAYLRAAVDFCNTRLAGSLSATLLIDPETASAHAAALEETLAGLRYGSIGVNIWGAGGFMLPGAAWGAYPGNTIDDVGSGIGMVHNAYLLDCAQKTVMRGQFRPLTRAWQHGAPNLMPKPLWYVTHKQALATARRVTYFALDPGWGHMPGLFAAALRG